jgi:hypothetical protein
VNRRDRRRSARDGDRFGLDAFDGWLHQCAAMVMEQISVMGHCGACGAELEPPVTFCVEVVPRGVVFALMHEQCARAHESDLGLPPGSTERAVAFN